MKLNVFIACAAITGFYASAAFPASRTYDQCMKHAQEVTVTSRGCQFDEEKRQDAEMNQTYAKLLHKLEKSDQLSLRKAQRAWLAFRDAECGFEMSPDRGGTLALLEAGDCSIALTDARIKQLKSSLKANTLSR